MIKLTLEEFHNKLREQKVPRRHLATVCPMCGRVQSMDCLIRAGAGNTEEEVEKYAGYSCVGRWTDAGPPRKEKDGKGCDWTLGGLFKLHECVVVTPDGKEHCHFAPATPEQAQALMAGKEGQQA